jgi:hypothetical protein
MAGVVSKPLNIGAAPGPTVVIVTVVAEVVYVVVATTPAAGAGAAGVAGAAAIAGAAGAAGAGAVTAGAGIRDIIIARPENTPNRFPIPLRQATTMLTTPIAVMIPGRVSEAFGCEYSSMAPSGGGGVGAWEDIVGSMILCI